MENSSGQLKLYKLILIIALSMMIAVFGCGGDTGGDDDDDDDSDNGATISCSEDQFSRCGGVPADCQCITATLQEHLDAGRIEFMKSSRRTISGPAVGGGYSTYYIYNAEWYRTIGCTGFSDDVCYAPNANWDAACDGLLYLCDDYGPCDDEQLISLSGNAGEWQLSPDGCDATSNLYDGNNDYIQIECDEGVDQDCKSGDLTW